MVLPADRPLAPPRLQVGVKVFLRGEQVGQHLCLGFHVGIHQRFPSPFVGVFNC